MEFKQVILVRQDLKLPKGKLAAQVGHACIEAFRKADKNIANSWINQGQKKVVVKVSSEKELIEYFMKAKNTGLATSLITDAGRTCIAPGTKTCVAIGPNEEIEIDEITNELKLL